MINPEDLVEGGTLRLLWWGAPHPNPSTGSACRHGGRATGVLAKNHALEAITWLCPSGTVAMPFPDKYPVALWQPRTSNETSEKTLICGRMLTRHYVPMMSGNGRLYAISNADGNNTMIAMQVAPTHLKCITWVDQYLDFSTTMKKIMATFQEEGYAVALGVYDCPLEMELLLVE